MTMGRTDYQELESSSTENRRLLRREELILEVTEALVEQLEKEGITRSQLAARLGRSKGFVSQVLAGRRNLTLRTIADVADALRCRMKIRVQREPDLLQLTSRDTVRYVAPVELAGEWSPKLLRATFGGSRRSGTAERPSEERMSA